MSKVSAVVSRVQTLVGRHFNSEWGAALSFDVVKPVAVNTQQVGVEIGADVPPELARLWELCGGLRLFEDVAKGQWGLVVYGAEEATRETISEKAEMPEFYRDGDILIGKFIGDQDRLLVRGDPGQEDFGSVLFVRPLDDRKEWDVLAKDVGEFLEAYLNANGNKYWPA